MNFHGPKQAENCYKFAECQSFFHNITSMVKYLGMTSFECTDSKTIINTFHAHATELISSEVLRCFQALRLEDYLSLLSIAVLGPQEKKHYWNNNFSSGKYFVTKCGLTLSLLHLILICICSKYLYKL